MRTGVLFLMMLWGAPAAAQTVASTSFLPRADFSFSWGSFISSDPRFGWDGVIAVDIDVIGYPRGRLNFAADYEAVLGHEARPFEINHDNFGLDASASYQLRSFTMAAAFHHVSRHLSDRANANIVAWNVLDIRASRRFQVGRAGLEAEIGVGEVLQHTFVDYTWTSDVRLRLHRPVSDRVALVASGAGRLVGVDAARYGREGQCGAKIEAGVRLRGRAAALELVAGYERRIDGYPTERTRMRAFTFCFRITSRQ